VHFGAGGEPDGYASYRVKESWERWLPNNSLIAVELVAEKSEVRERLFRALLSMDLIRTVTLRLAPVDGPLRWLLGDLRQLRTNFVADELWLRLLDVPRALAARSYNMPGRLVIDLQDQLFPVKSGRYLLETEGDGRAEVSPTQEPEDVALDASALGSAYLGGVSFETLRQAGRLEERRPGACRRADLMFREEPPPFSGTEF
jgi:predicted acetyltransferase